MQHQTVCRCREWHRARALECAVAQRVLQLLQAELAAAYDENKLTQPSARWRSGGFSQRQRECMPQAAPGSGQPRSISRLGGSGRPRRVWF